MHLTLPIYWTKVFKTKPDKTVLCGMNWYRDAHYHEKNKVKKEFSELVYKQLGAEFPPIAGGYTMHYDLFYKNPNCDGANIVAFSEKVVLDAIQEINIVTNDNVKYHKGSTWSVADQDKENPRVEITIKPI